MPDKSLLNARQAAARLGVKVETLYAYVSRGELANHRKPGTRASLFRERDIEWLRMRGRGQNTAADATAVLETSLTLLRGDALLYRGKSVSDLAQAHSFERVAEWLWRGDAHVLTGLAPEWHPAPEVLAAARGARFLGHREPLSRPVRRGASLR